MKYRILGKTGLNTSLIGMGCSGIGKSLHRHNDKEALLTLTQAFESGINFFDTAPNYSDGRSERLISEALGTKRDKIIISGKVGVAFTPLGSFAKKIKPFLTPVRKILSPVKKNLPDLYRSQRRSNFSRGFIFSTVEGSLKRLKTDYLDLLLLHHPDDETLTKGDFCASFERLRSQGKIRYYGVSCDSVEQALLSMELPGVSVIQIELNMIDRDPLSSVLPLAGKNNIGVIVRKPLAQGLLTDQVSDTKAERWAYDPTAFKARKIISEKIKESLKDKSSIVNTALQFLYQHKEISTVLAGFSSRPHLREILASLNSDPLPAELQNILTSVYQNE